MVGWWPWWARPALGQSGLALGLAPAWAQPALVPGRPKAWEVLGNWWQERLCATWELLSGEWGPNQQQETCFWARGF